MKLGKIVSLLLSVLIVIGVCFVPCTTLAQGSANTVSTNGNGYNTDIGIWYVPYNTPQLFNSGWAGIPIGHRQLIGYDENGDEIFGIPNSADLDMLDFDIEQIANAGIDFIVIDLTNGGLANTKQYDSDGNEIENHVMEKVNFHVTNSIKFCQRIAEWNKKNDWKIRYAIAVGTHASITHPVWYNYVSQAPATESKYNNYVGEYDCTVAEAGEWQAEAVYKYFYTDEEIGGDNYYHLDGKPLILFHDWARNSLTCKPTTTYLSPNGIKDPTLVGWNMYEGKNYGNYFTVRASQAGEAGTYGWHTTTTNATGNSEVELICPSHLTAGTKIAESNLTRDNGNRYKSSWDSVLARDTLPRIIMLSAYNDYCEDHAIAVTDTSGCDGVYDEVWYDPDGNYSTDYYWNLTKTNIAAVRERAGKSDTVNFASSATVDCATSEWLQNNGFSKEQLIDGVTDSDTSDGLKWASALYGADNYCYFELSFNSPKIINNVVFTHPEYQLSYRPTELAVDVKLSDGSWVRVAEKHNINVADKTELVHNFVFETCFDVTAVRLTGNKARNSSLNEIMNMHAAELEVYYNPAYTFADYTGIEKEANAIYQIPTPADDVVGVSNNYALSSLQGIATGNKATNNSYKIEYLNDGLTDDVFKFATTVFSGDIGWFQVDFAAPRTINQVVAIKTNQQANMQPKEIAIDVCLSDGRWIRVAEKHNVSLSGSKQTYNFETVEKVIAVRYYGNKARNSAATSNMHLLELEAYYNTTLTENDFTALEEADSDAYAIPTTQPADSGNFALKGTAYTSNTNEGLFNTYHPSLVNNGIYTPDNTDDNTILNYLKTGDAFIGIKLDKEYTVNKVILKASSHEAPRRVKDVAIDVRLKNGKWVRVAEMHNISQTREVTFYFAPVRCVDVRIVTNRARLTDNQNWRVGEIEIYNDSTVTSSQYSGITLPENAAYILRMWDNTTNDVNNDYVLDAKDMVSLKKCLLGVGNHRHQADINADEVVNILDMIQYKKQIKY